MKTRAAVALEKGKPLTVTDVELDGPKASEVLVEIKATGICPAVPARAMGLGAHSRKVGHLNTVLSESFRAWTQRAAHRRTRMAPIRQARLANLKTGIARQ